MNHVLAVHAEDLDCVIEPGITRKQLNEHLRDKGVFFPIDPGADASLGGMAATRASGTNAVRYGTMKDNVLALKVVLANGEVITTGAARQEILGRLRPHPADGRLRRHARHHHRTDAAARPAFRKRSAAAICPFPSVEAACNATILTIQSGIPVARIELLDALQVKACNLYSKLSLPETPMLFLEFHGTDAGVAEQSERFGEIAKELGGGPFDWATRAEDRTRLWQARHDALLVDPSGCGPGAEALSSDVCVPISRLAECVSARPSATPRRAASSRRSSAMSATAISIMLLLVDMQRRRRGQARRGICSNGWSSARWRWTAPAPASTASARAR